jgi:hypothetical protein
VGDLQVADDETAATLVRELRHLISGADSQAIPRSDRRKHFYSHMQIALHKQQTSTERERERQPAAEHDVQVRLLRMFVCLLERNLQREHTTEIEIEIVR